MEYTYPHTRQLKMKSKYSVSELNAAQLQPVESLEEPKSFKRSGFFTPAQKGTIYHTLLEHLDFRSAWESPEEVEVLKQWLVENQFLTEEETAIIDSAIILKLVNSELGQRMAAAEAEGRIWRERPFNLKMDYDPDGSGTEEEVLVQGVIDCYFEEEDGLVLVDYKTGHGRNAAVQYQTQIEIYRRALEAATGRPVKEAYLYLTGSGQLEELK